MKWPKLSIEDLCTEVHSGGTPSTTRDDYYGGTIPWLRTQEVTFDPIWDTEVKITEKGLKGSAANWIPKNSVIIAMYGASAGRVAINKIPLTTNQACCNLVIDNNKADYRYMYYALRQSFVTLESLAKGAAQTNLNASQIKGFKIPAPPLSEQQRIADILSAYDDLIENNRRRIRLLEQAARLLYKEWFVHLRFPGHEHIKIKHGIPAEWESGTIADYFDTTSGGTPSRKHPEFYDGNINWVKTQELHEDFIFETEEKITVDALKNSSAKLFAENTLLVSIYGGTNIGRTGILAAPAASNQACVALFPLHASANYIYAQLFFQNIRENLIGVSQGAAQTNISQQTVRKVKMLMPTTTLMQNFLASVSPMYDQVKTLKQQNMRLEKARDLLLPRLMNGNIAV